jgi:Cu(I)/Ag(I) efflux system membrane fusion protein
MAASAAQSDTPYQSGPFKVGVAISPEKPVVGNNALRIVLHDRDDEPVSGARINAVAMMPAMGTMPEMRAPAEIEEVGPGIYEGTFELTMEGAWPLMIRISEPKAGSAELSFDMATNFAGLRLTSGSDAGPESEDASAATSTVKRAVITVAPEVMQSMGVRLAKAEQTQFGRAIRSFGRVTENERLQTEISSRVEGWITKLKTTAVGDEVSKGDLLFEMYSPQLVVSQNDYIRPRSADLRGRGVAQLKSLGVQQKAIDEMQGREQPMQDVPFYADRNGVVSELSIREGSHVQRGTLMARIQDYSTVWLMVGVAEKDLGFISRDTPATVTFPSLPAHKVEARVDYIYPTVDEKTRTGRVRLVVDNPDGRLRPGSYADVTFEVGAQLRVAVPAEAVLRSGEGSHVVVSLGGGRFEPRAVETGLSSGRWTEVVRGVKPGEQIVVSGQFLLDSGSALRESFRKLERAQVPLSLLKLDTNEMAMVDRLVDGALYLHEALVDGYSVQADFLDPAVSIRDLMWPRYRDTQLALVLEDATAALKKAREARAVSETQAALADLVAALRPWILNGAPEYYRERGVALFREKDGERLWLQMKGDAINPYSRAPGEQLPWPDVPETPAASAEPEADASESRQSSLIQHH